MKKLYVLINKKLERNQKAVQAGHAVSKYASKHPEINWDKQTFVYLDATEFQIKKFIYELDLNNIEWYNFIDTELHGDIITAMACIPDNNSTFSKMYAKFNCMKL